MSKKLNQSSESEKKENSSLEEQLEVQPATPAGTEKSAQDSPSDCGSKLLDYPGSFVKSAAHTVVGVGNAIGHKVSETGEAIAKTSVDVGGAIGHKVSETGEVIAKTSVDVGGAIGHTASQTGESVLKAATTLGNAAFKQTHRLIEQTTSGTGHAVAYVGDSPLIRKLVSALKLDWLPGISEQVDLVKATEAVRQLQQAHPNESASQIAHRVMVEKAVYAGGVGLATSLVPGEAIALLAVDLATTTALQTEMLYQIAAAYGLDLKDPARRGEVLAIFGLALGGSRAVRAGLVFVKNVPLAGAVIGASANATILYALGYAACRFYEAKLDPQVAETSTETLQGIEQKSEHYLEVAIAQQTLVDQILAHMILASYPEKSWEDILPNLQSIELHPQSLQAIANNLKAPQPLGALIDQLNRDFAVLTLSRCYKIAQLDNHVSPEEAKILEAIGEKFGIDLEAIKRLAAGSTDGNTVTP
jgi:uncharacterized protein (DUF697 family)